MFYIFQQCTWTTADDNGRLVGGQFFFHNGITLFQVIWIHYADSLKSHCSAEGFQIDLTCRISLDVVACQGILLMAGHTGNGVIQHDNGRITLVISNIGKTGHAGMHKGGVTDYGYGFVLALFAKCLIKSMDRTDGGSHAKCHLHGI